MQRYKQQFLSCPLLPPRSRDKENSYQQTAAASREPILPAENAKDLDWALGMLRLGNPSLHNISIHQTQTTSGSFQETENSLSVYISKNSNDNSTYLSQILSLLSAENVQRSLKSLEIHGIEWESEDLRCLRLLLDNNLSISQLMFQHSSFGAEGLFEISEILTRNKGIQVAIFFDCQIGWAGVGLIASALKANQTLKELQIWEDSIGSRGAEELSKMIEVNSTLTLLIILDTSFLTATPVISSVLARNRAMEVHVWSKDDEDGRSKVVEFTPVNHVLRIYRLSSSGARRACVALGWNTTVRTLDMTGMRLNSKWAKEFRCILETNKSLKAVILSNTGLRDKAVVYVAAGLFKNETLESLQLDGNLFSGLGVDYLLCPLTCFSVMHNQANTTLKSVTFGGKRAKISGIGVMAILQMLETNQSIVSLGIYEDTTMRPHDIVKIFQSLEKNATLRRLSLRGCQGVAGEPVLQAIMGTLEINSSIEEVDLSRTPLENEGKMEALYQKLGRNGGMELEKEQISDLPLAAPTNCRIFFCGQDFTGKTTLANSLSLNFSSAKLPFWNNIRLAVDSSDFGFKTPEVKIKTLQDNNLKISFLILPGRQEFYTLHDLLFPGGGSPSLFLIICSLVKSDNKQMKSLDAIEEDLLYWLRFIVSNSRRSQPQYLLPNVTIVLTYFDKIPRESVKLQAIVKLVDKLREKFEEFLDFYPTVFAVDARSSASVIKLAHHLRKTSKTILERVPQTYKVCDDLIEALKIWRSENHNKPIIRWNEFCQLCQLGIPSLRIRWRHGDAEIDLRRRTVANSLHYLGEVIFFEGHGLLVLDIEWFCNDVVINLINLDASKRNHADKSGFISKKVLEKILQRSLQSQIPGMGPKVFDNLEASDLIHMMLKLELCFEQNPGNPESPLLIPAILEEDRGRGQKWPVSSMDCVHVGRRIECDESNHMFLTAGFFSRLQVHLYNKLCNPKNPYSASYSLEKSLISITINSIRIRVELGGQLGHCIDILGCALKSNSEILGLFHKLIIPAIHDLFHGVCLMESIIRPDCVKYLIPPRYRKNQILPVQKLKQLLLTLPAESFQDYQHAWSAISDGTKLVLQAGLNYTIDLLSHDEMREVLHRRYYDLHHLATQLAVRVNNEHVQNQASKNEADSMIDPSLVGIAKGVEAVLQRLKRIESEIRDIKQEIQSLRYYEHRLLVELYRRVDYLVNFNIQSEERRFPHMFYFVHTENNSRRLVTRIIPGMTVLQLHMLCEYRGEMHVVEDQVGCELVQVDNNTVSYLLPYMTKFMKLLTFALKIGAHFAVGMAELIPDLSREIARLVSSPAAMGAAAMAAGAIGVSAVGQFVGGRQRNRSVPANAGGKGHIGPDVIAARQWLIDFLKDQGITSGKDIAERFGLWRVRYRDNGQIAWICRRHGQLRAIQIIEAPI